MLEILGKGESGKVLGHRQQIEKLAVSSCGTVLAAASSRLFGNVWDGELRIWTFKDVGDREVEMEAQCAVSIGCSIADVKWVTDKHTLLIAGDDGSSYLFQLKQGKDFEELVWQNTFTDHEDVLTCIAVNKKQFVSSGFDGMLKLWDFANSETPTCSTGPHRSSALKSKIVWDVMWKDENTVLSCHQDGYIRGWDTRHQLGSPVVEYHASGLSCLSICERAIENKVACGFEDGSIGLIDFRSNVLDNFGPVHGAACHAVELFECPEGGVHFLSGADDGTVMALPFASHEVQNTKPVALHETDGFHADFVRSVAIRPHPPTHNSKQPIQILSGSWDGFINLYNFEQDKIVRL